MISLQIYVSLLNTLQQQQDHYPCLAYANTEIKETKNNFSFLLSVAHTGKILLVS